MKRCHDRPDHRDEAGVALVFALVVMSIVVLIGLSVSLTALRMYTNAATVRDSIAATFAMDAALECALYHAQQSPNPFAGGATTITCNGSSVTTTVAGGTHRFEVPVGLGVGRAEVRVVSGAVQIDASGYSRTAPQAARLVGRSLAVEVSQGGYPQRADIMLILDASTSMNEAVERAALKGAVQEILNRTSPYLSSTGIQMGILHFNRYAGALSDPAAFIREPHVPLTADPVELGQYLTNNVYPSHAASIAVSGTNLPQALALARAELMGRAYQSNVFENASFNGSPAYSYFPTTGRDRNDATWPDYIIVLTDGNPTHYTPPLAVADDSWINNAGQSQTYSRNMADLLKAEGVKIYVIGIGVDAATEAYLKNHIVNDPSHYASSVFDVVAIVDAFEQLFRSAEFKDIR